MTSIMQYVLAPDGPYRLRDHLIIRRDSERSRCGAQGRPRVVYEMINVMQYMLSQDGEFVRVNEQGYEYTGMFMVPGNT